MLGYTYDAHGNTTHISASDANGVDLGYTYDALNRLENVDDTQNGATTYGYDAVGNLPGYRHCQWCGVCTRSKQRTYRTILSKAMRTIESVHFESFIRHGGQLLPIERFDQSIVDTDYIEGAMRLTVSGKELLSPQMWDYIDQLWAYVITGADRVKLGSEYSTYYPDQPIRFALYPLESSSRVRIRVEAREIIEASAPTKIFLASAADGAEVFFSQLQRLLPQLTPADIRYWEIAKRLRADCT